MAAVIDKHDAKKLLGFNLNRILDDRAQQGLPHSRYWLAKQLNVTDMRIKLICDGENEPGWSFVLNLAEVLGVSETELWKPLSAGKTSNSKKSGSKLELVS